MDQNTQLLMQRLEANSRKQTALATIQCVFSVIAALCCIALLVTGLTIFPRVKDAAQQAEVVLENLESVTTELASADLTGMVAHMDDLVSNVDGLVDVSQDGIENTLKKIEAIDLDTLNKAIQDLSDVLEPIANFFNGFRGR